MSRPGDTVFYAHAGETLLPLIRSQLPHAIAIYGSIVAHTREIRTTKGVSPECILPSVYASFPPREDGGDITPESLTSMGIDEFDWLVTVALPYPSEQIRFYHSIVSAPRTIQTAKFSTASTRVRHALAHMRDQYPEQPVVGCTHELFEPIVRDFTGSPQRHETYIYMAPELGFGETSLNDVRTDWQKTLEAGPGQPVDAQMIYDTNPYRLVEYYATRSPFITVLRPLSQPSQTSDVAAPVAWVMTHGDGSLGALWTQPNHRRLGLAKVLLKLHLADQTRYGIPAFCYVEAGNVASMLLWESLGWQRLPWISYWLYTTSKTGQEIG